MSHVINPCKCVRLHMHTRGRALVGIFFFLLLDSSAAAGALKLRDDPWHKQKLSLALPEKQKLPKESLRRQAAKKKENGWIES